MIAHQAFIVFSIFAAFSVGAYALLPFCNPYWLRVRSRMGELHEHGDAKPKTARAPSGAPAMGTSGSIVLKKILAPLRLGDRARWQNRLIKAGIYHPAALSRLFACRVLLATMPPTVAIAATFFGYIRLETALLVGGISGGFGSLAPSLWLDRAVARHHLFLQRSLPDFLDLMIVCLEGGMSLQETIRRVGDELLLVHPDFAFELGVVQRDIELGATVDQSLKRFASRTDYEGIKTLSTFIREAQRFGTNITEALRNHSEMLRSQREQAAEENAQKASVKILLPTLLLIFPGIFIVIAGPAIIQIQEAFAAK